MIANNKTCLKNDALDRENANQSLIDYVRVTENSRQIHWSTSGNHYFLIADVEFCPGVKSGVYIEI